MAPQPGSGQQLAAGGHQPVTAEAIAAQSQDYVDENLAAFQVDNDWHMSPLGNINTLY